MIHSINLLSCISLLIGLVTVNGSPINTSPQLQSRTEMWIVGYDFLEPNAARRTIGKTSIHQHSFKTAESKFVYKRHLCHPS
ncbi:hypothetical protein BT96DRAFT_441579 [Gymnopus androsaceus JB14]|uniref:Secreted protein n=1 Tax=Gymnopus androsaceus JB14 TaxID=1447944 RepID=A0A6A4GR75_9AGAR|nr:hypothetical protein BT96DRAFT_441579 [Gymnopus androsaceus JB14]